MRKHAFTLVELLVVIGIIAILIAILLPVLARARFHAKFTACASNERQVVMGMLMYAGENKGFFPRFDGGFNNLWDLHPRWYETLNEVYDQPKSMFFCPDGSEDLPDSLWTTFLPSFYLLGYSLWTPRHNGWALCPPELGDPGFPILDTRPFRGPVRIGDRAEYVANPLLTDSIITDPGMSPNVDLASDASSLTAAGIYAWTPHRWKGLLNGINAAYADGHVERVDGHAVKARFFVNYWNWR